MLPLNSLNPSTPWLCIVSNRCQVQGSTPPASFVRALRVAAGSCTEAKVQRAFQVHSLGRFLNAHLAPMHSHVFHRVRTKCGSPRDCIPWTSSACQNSKYRSEPNGRVASKFFFNIQSAPYLLLLDSCRQSVYVHADLYSHRGRLTPALSAC